MTMSVHDALEAWAEGRIPVEQAFALTGERSVADLLVLCHVCDVSRPLLAGPPNVAAHPPVARPSREERLARLCPEDRAAVEVWSLGRRARDMAASGNPDAPAAEAAYREAEAAAIEAGILMRRVDVEDLRARYSVLSRDAEVTIGVGWQPLLEALFDRLAGMSVLVPLVREKFGGLDAKVYPVGSWIHAEFNAMAGIKAPAQEAALRTCEACGAPGTIRRDGRWRTRCDRHADL